MFSSCLLVYYHRKIDYVFLCSPQNCNLKGLESCEPVDREIKTQALIRVHVRVRHQHVTFSRDFSKEIHQLSPFTNF